MIGCRSQLVLDVEPMSNLCSKCTKNLPHDEEMCPKNVNCSAKAMEAIGSANITQNLFRNYKAFVYE
jgi:predicted amidophosphoribosyltransferase